MRVSTTVRLSLGLVAVLGFLCSGASPALPDPGFKETGKPATVSGELKRVCSFDRTGGVEQWFIVGVEEGAAEPARTYSVHFGKDKPDHLSTGDQVTAKGQLNGSALSVSSGRDDASLSLKSQTTTASVGGSLSVTAIIVNYPGNVQGCTPADVNWMLNNAPNSLVSYYPEASSGSFSISATCKAAVTVEYSDDVWTLAARADQAAGVSSGNRMYILAPGSWGWAGLGELGGKRCWINTLTSWMLVYTHEVGHNLGMHHAGRWGGEYGDYSCTMGNSGVPPLLNGPHKVQMGWVSPTSVSANGVYTYTLTHLEIKSGVQVLKIPKIDTSENYYVSYRAPVGLDASNLPADFHYCTSIHTWYGGMSLTWVASVIGDGQTFSDALNGVTVTQVGHDATTATVQVALQLPAKPIASITPSSSRGRAPMTVTFDGGASRDPDGSIVGYSWYMPDGTTITGTSTVTWTFTNSGTWYVNLTVTDNSGLTGSTNAKVRLR